MSKTAQLQQRVIGSERDWVWRGWQTRYTYQRPAQPTNLPPVLLLHGFGASIGHWQHNLEFLAQHHCVYAIDTLGFGGSRKPKIEYDIDLWVEQVYDFWQQFIGVPTIIIGNSIGAHPEMAVTVVMISLPDLSAEQELIPKLLQPAVNGIKRTIASPLLLHPLFRLVSQPWVARRWAKIAYANPDRVTDELLEMFLAPSREKEAAAAFVKIIQGMTSTDFSPNIRHLLPEMNMPMLMIWGTSDRMIPADSADTLLQINPQLKLIEIPNAGHCAHDEAPEAVNQILRNWLDGLRASKVTIDRLPAQPRAVDWLHKSKLTVGE
jgi:pimeloyl-ACP methyl ester carboxylesterase